MFGAAVAYDEVKYKYTDLQSLVASCFATGQVLHKAYDEIKDLLITLMQSLASNRFAHGQVLHKAYDEIKDFCRLLKNSSPSAKHRKTAY